MFQPDHFRFITDSQKARSLFKSSVEFIEIEIFSYCNRTCVHCGNFTIDRRSSLTLLEPGIYSKVMADLAEIDFCGTIWYSRYNEPTANRVFLDRLREARAKLPRSVLATYSNGDYLNADYIAELRDAGLNDLRMMIYLPVNVEPTTANFIAAMYERLKRLGLPWSLTAENSAKVEVSGIKVSVLFSDYTTTGTNRGGALNCGKIIDRRSPCLMSLKTIYVDYNGMMVPCCDIRSDFERHHECIVYQLTPDNSIFEAYANSKLVLWRRSLLRFGKKQFPCDNCSRWIEDASPEAIRAYARAAKMADQAMAEDASKGIAVYMKAGEPNG